MKADTQKTSELDKIIAPKIKNDEFYRLIEKLSAEEPLDYVLEIGSSAGGGSTGAFLAGLSAKPRPPKLFCVEISKARFEVLTSALKPYAFAHCYNLSTVRIDEFPSQTEVIRFYNCVETKLNNYPVVQVLEWLQQDIDYVREGGVDAGAIEQIKADYNISQFDMVLIDGSEFTGDAEFKKVEGARIILLDDTNTFKCYKVRESLLRNPDYELIADNQNLRNGFSAFRRRDRRSKPLNLPIHFFTIVLNGEPFIRYHENVLANLKHDWHWHIVEGVAALKHDTAWSVAAGGHIAGSIHDQGRSNDGTSFYLDDLARRFPKHVTIYRKPLGEFWDGKREMVSAPMPNIRDECLLWQIDADELWTLRQIDTVHAMFMREPDRTAAMYWCWYFVGPRKIISTRYNYAQNPNQEWLRTWRYQPGDRWLAHEPPTLTRGDQGSKPFDIAKIHPFTHDDMERAGVIFQHFAYVMESQLAFKEIYYGYKDARTQWRRLQEQSKPGLLRDFLEWVPDETMFDNFKNYDVDLLAAEDQSGAWRFQELREPNVTSRESRALSSSIMLDGLIWQFEDSEHGRFWANVLREWVRTGFVDKVVVVDRGGTAPRIEGVHYWTVGRYDRDYVGHDSVMLERLCEMFGTRAFVSTGKSTPTATQSCLVQFDHADLLPSLNNSPDENELFQHATGLIAVGAERPSFVGKTVDRFIRAWTVPPGVSLPSIPYGAWDIDAFRCECGLGLRPYVMMAGNKSGDIRPIVAAASLVASQESFAFLSALDPASVMTLQAELAPQADILHFDMSQHAWLAALAGAHALICPSTSTAPTLAALEAMAAGCPVIICGHDTVQTILGMAAIFVGEDDPVAIAASLRRLLNPLFRQTLVEQGHRLAQTFSMEQTASALADALLQFDVADENGGGPLVDRRGWVALRAFQKAAEETRDIRLQSEGEALVKSPDLSNHANPPGLFNWLRRRMRT